MDRNIPTNQKLLTIVRDRNTIFFHGEVKAISSINDKGPFDILPQHANFISIIKKYVVLRIQEKQEKRIELESGILKVRNNNVEIYLGILQR